MSSGGGIRDRTSEFQQTMAAVEGEKAEEKKREKFFGRMFNRKRSNLTLNGDSNGNDVEGFLQKIERIKSDTEQLKEMCATVIRQCNDFVTSSPFRENWKKEEIENKMTVVKSLSRSIHNRLKEIENQFQGGDHLNSAHGRIQTTQYRSCLGEFCKVMTDYNTGVSNYRDRCLTSIMKRLEITGSSKSAEDVEALMEDGNWSVFTGGLLMESQKARDELNQIQDRYTFLLKMEKSISELNDMFLQMALLVQEQGETIDSIERHVETTVNFTNEGAKNLDEAHKSKKKWRKRKIILICGGVVIVALIVTILILA